MDHTANDRRMTLDEYQASAMLSAIYPEQGTFWGLTYCVLKLNGEAGECAEHAGKAIRDDHSILTEWRREQMIKELGDVLWYVANAARELNCSMQYIAECNIAKLKSRKERGVLQGSGSDR